MLESFSLKHVKPDYCADLAVPKVNPEIWCQLDNFKHKADLRLGNIQDLDESDCIHWIAPKQVWCGTTTEEKVKAIQETEAPSNVAELESFLILQQLRIRGC